MYVHTMDMSRAQTEKKDDESSVQIKERDGTRSRWKENVTVFPFLLDLETYYHIFLFFNLKIYK